MSGQKLQIKINVLRLKTRAKSVELREEVVKTEKLI